MQNLSTVTISYVVDNKSGNETEFENLQNKLFQHISQQSSWGRQIPVRWIKLKADLMVKSRNENKRFMSLTNVISLAKQCGINEDETESFLRMENALGDFIFYSELELRTIVIIDPQWLIDKVSILLNHHRFSESQRLKSATEKYLNVGNITKIELEEIWKEREAEYLIQLMVHFNLIIPVDKSIQRYIIPSMLPSENQKTQEQAFENMELVYSAFHTPNFGNTFFIETFHQLITECSKIKMWRPCTGKGPSLLYLCII